MTSSPILITHTTSPEYSIYASWGPRAEPPEAIAPHYLACIDRLKQVHPAYDNWIFNLKGKPKKFDALREKLAEAVAANVDPSGRMANRHQSMAIGRLSPIP